jgi:peptide deformylase
MLQNLYKYKYDILFIIVEQLKIYTVKNKEEEKFLRKKSKYISEEEIKSKEFKAFLKKLLYTAKNSEEQIGIPAGGIAAPQVGDSRRVFYILRSNTEDWEVYINPEFKPLDFSKIITTEGCLSVPDREGDVMRYKKIEVKYQDINGEWKKEKLFDIDAVAIQHELDHLDGILFIDKIE